MRRTQLVALASGVIFAVGLGLGGMTQPAKVIGFLDVFGAWDPTLAFVMLGAVIVHMPFAIRARRPEARPALAPRFVLPTKTRIDGRLVLGAVLFGIGWGAAGFCPGPSVVALVALSPSTWLFVAAMLLGMLVHTSEARSPRR